MERWSVVVGGGTARITRFPGWACASGACAFGSSAARLAGRLKPSVVVSSVSVHPAPRPTGVRSVGTKRTILGGLLSRRGELGSHRSSPLSESRKVAFRATLYDQVPVMVMRTD